MFRSDLKDEHQAFQTLGLHNTEIILPKNLNMLLNLGADIINKKNMQLKCVDDN